MILLQWKLFHSFDCVAFNHNSNQKLMFLCHDRIKELSLHRWGTARGEEKSNDGNVLCIRLFISCHLAQFLFWGGESKEGGGTYGQKLLTSFHLLRVYFRDADYQQCLDRRLAIQAWFLCALWICAQPPTIPHPEASGTGWVLAQEQPGTDHRFLFPHPASTMQTGPGPQRFVHRLCSQFAMQMVVWAGRWIPRRWQLGHWTESWVLGSNCVTTKSGFDLPESQSSIWEVYSAACLAAPPSRGPILGSTGEPADLLSGTIPHPVLGLLLLHVSFSSWEKMLQVSWALDLGYL